MGASEADYGFGVAVDEAGNVLLTGYTESTNFPVPGGFDTSYNGNRDVFVAKVTNSCQLSWASYFGGSAYDIGYGVAVDFSGNVFLAGETRSTNFPSQGGGFGTSYNGGTNDAFIAKVTSLGQLSWASYLGGNGKDWSQGVATDSLGNIFLTGVTSSTNFPVPGGFDTSHNGGEDVFVAKISNTGGGTIDVTASAVYNTNTKQLTISAQAYNRTNGSYITTGSGSYYINGLGKNGQLTYSSGQWGAVVDLSANPPGPGQYTVSVNIAGGSATCIFNVAGNTISINGVVKDVDGIELSGIPVALYSSNNYFSSSPNSLDTNSTDANGFYHFDNLPPAWYIVDINTAGYIPDYQYCWGITNAETVQVDFVLTPTRTLAKLLSNMSYLRDDIEQAMGYETGLFSVISYQAVQDLSYKSPEAIDAISCMGDMLAGFPGVFNSIPMAQAELYRKICRDMLLQPVLKAIAKEGIEYLVRVDAQKLLPDDMDDWKVWDFCELTEMDTYTAADANLVASDSNFVANARLTPVASAFDYKKAKQVIESQRSQIWELRKGETTIFLALPDSNDPDSFMGVGLPIGYQLWLINHAAISHFGVQKRIWTSVQIGSGTAAVGSVCTGAGPAVFGTICVAATYAKATSGFAETMAGFAGGITYGFNALGWTRDIAALPLPYIETNQFLVNEAPNPYYLSNANTFKADASLNLNIPTGNILFALPFLPATYNNASVQVTNTSNVPAPIRIVPRGWWDYQLPGEFPFLGELFGGVRQIKAPTTVGAPQSVWLTPSESTTVSVPYFGFYLDPINMFSPHWLAVDIYAGPFLVKSLSQPYFVFKVTPLLMSSTEGQKEQNMDLTASFVENDQPRSMAEEDYAEMMPLITTLAVSDVNANVPIIAEQFTADANTWSLCFKLIADERAHIALQVYDSNGNCVGYDESNGGVQNEFIAAYAGDGSGAQDVTIPGAAGRAYTVKAVLEGAGTGESFGVQLTAFEAPIRPAVLVAMPANISVISQPDNNVTLQVTLGEAGQQQPVHDVNVGLSNLIGQDPNTTLSIVGPNCVDINDIPAASSQVASFTVNVPRNVPASTYTGRIIVTSANAGNITIPVTVLTTALEDLTYDGTIDTNDVGVFSNQWLQSSGPPADFNMDGRVDFRDYAQLATAWLSEADWLAN